MLTSKIGVESKKPRPAPIRQREVAKPCRKMAGLPPNIGSGLPNIGPVNKSSGTSNNLKWMKIKNPVRNKAVTLPINIPAHIPIIPKVESPDALRVYDFNIAPINPRGKASLTSAEAFFIAIVSAYTDDRDKAIPCCDSFSVHINSSLPSVSIPLIPSLLCRGRAKQNRLHKRGPGHLFSHGRSTYIL